MAGDLTSSQLGISEDMQAELAEKVSVVLHMAATVQFNEPMKIAVRTPMLILYPLKQSFFYIYFRSFSFRSFPFSLPPTPNPITLSHNVS